MEAHKDGTDLGVFDELAPPAKSPRLPPPPAGDSKPPALVGAPTPPLPAAPPVRPSAVPGLPPPPPSRPSVAGSATPSGSDLTALLARSGKVAGAVPPARQSPPPPPSLRTGSLPPPPPLRAGSVPPPPPALLRASAVPPPPLQALPLPSGSLPPLPTLPPPSAAFAPEDPDRSFDSFPATTVPSLPTAIDQGATRRNAKSGRGVAATIAALLLVGGIAGGTALFFSRSGTLRVYVSGRDGTDVGAVDIFIDNHRVCTSSPCTVPSLEPGIHDVYAEAKGYAPTATKGIEIKPGGEAKFEIALFQASGGFKIASPQPGLKLLVDGKEAGALPQSIDTLPLGEHELRITGSERYAPLTKTVTVSRDRVEDLGEVKLEVVKGQATFAVAREGIRMRLVSGDGQVRLLDKESVENQRVSVDVDASKEWKLEACELGYEPFELPISFADGQAEKTFEVNLVKNASMGAARQQSWCRAPAVASAPPSNATAPRAAAAKPSSATASGGMLSFNSVPPSAAVVLDGKPVGRTPMSGVAVAPGTHSVIFIHPQKGRKTASVTVKAGQRTGVGVRF